LIPQPNYSRPTQSCIKWVPEPLSLRIKRSGRDADLCPPFHAEVRNGWNCFHTPICLNDVENDSFILPLFSYNSAADLMKFFHWTGCPNSDCKQLRVITSVFTSILLLYYRVPWSTWCRFFVHKGVFDFLLCCDLVLANFTHFTSK
jgi:hypothetical protein